MNGRPPERPGDDGPDAPPVDAHKPSDEASDRSARPETGPPKDRINYVTNVFNAAVDASGGIFGTSEGSGGAAQNPVTGPLDDDVVRSVLDGFVRPVEFDAALSALRAERVLVLSGAPGTGRRTGAVALAHAVPARRLVVLSPTQTLSDLSERDLATGTGYIVLDWFGVDRACPQPQNEYLWSLVLRHVKESGAWLVLTRDGRTPVGRTAPVQDWSRPRPGDVLRAHLPDDIDDEAVAQAVAALSDDHSVSGLVAVAERMANGEDPPEAVAREQRTSARERVRQWFTEQPPSRRDLTDATALALLLGAPERDYETQAEALHARLNRELPPPPVPPRCAALPPVEAPEEALEERERDRLPERRGRRGSGSHPLIRVRALDDGWVTRRHPVFVDAEDRDAVLRQLWERYDAAYWDVVREWAETVVQQRRGGVYLARGLAALSRVAFDEVHDVYLDGWSRQADSGGWYACLYTLWFMSMDDDLAPTALRTADRWLDSGTAAQVGTAVSVWSGHLGVRYPTDAFNRLWSRLTDEHAVRRGQAALAVGSLFGSLVDRSGNARSLISMLSRQVPRSPRFGPHRILRDLVLTAVHATLSVPASDSLADGPLSEDWWESRQGGRTPVEPQARPDRPQEEKDQEREKEQGKHAVEREAPAPAPAAAPAPSPAPAPARAVDAFDPPDHSDGPADDVSPDQAEEARFGDRAIARHLLHHPDQIPEAANLWNAVIQYRPLRWSAMVSLWDTLCELQRSGPEAQDTAKALITELSEVMDPQDHEGFRASFTGLARSRERGDAFTHAVLDILIRVFGRTDRLHAGSGDGTGPAPSKKATAV